MDELSQEIKDKLTKTCLCNGITRATIKKTIKEGADSLEKVKHSTKAGSGTCKGNRCDYKIIELLKQDQDND
ncbi:(2Fe-2S)-binding protein [Desulfuribacillus stibiiarsenatis]|uniref:(2Fe-2S)-binding protein n=1 Tax=Desulfuribacillus stibiiarsenatis TaxID=1390249 RepID=A0A1E5L4W8_9FIRM|nr:(2Fe-2S)-binding protein [Desulfuribacillus stibiiarsenatis]OEH85108.1 (2Fe-2S)-binding protein [Desulfuribacillus stibiiarsenatis]